MTLPKLVCLCCTYLRPQLLASMIRDFEQFDYPEDKKELLIYDDVGQYPSEPSGPGWSIISVKNKHASLGEKRNALASIAPADADGYVVMDDDDGYCAWTLRAHADALQNAGVSMPSRILSEHRQSRQILLERGKGVFHGAWAFTPEAFKKAGGYSHKDTGEDRDLHRGFVRAGLDIADSCENWPPYYIYRWHHTGSYHISGLSQNGRELLKDDWKKCPVVEVLPDPEERNWTSAVSEYFRIEGNVSEHWIQNKADLLKRTEP
ncbi:glycosyltransferase [Gimesia fumaroli]|uniref:Glycosyl transferase family 2 n=1 Tax=Gimesia fumaroli TaxID=2527976 RepID=A0A518I8Y5_9PLAN|nr:hypothetical protein [Gimesia fumaroli]QDV49524.1 hypothetical protein Enr17x_15430 [Gimesia fumaroli]